MNINVTRTEVIVGNGYIVNKGEYKINPCVFTFSQEYTANLVKKAVFDDGKTQKEMAIINNRCEIPYEVLDSDSFQLRVYAYRVNEQELELVYSPTPAIIYLREGSYRGVTGSGEIITPTQYEQYEQALNDGLDDLETGLQEVSNVDIDVSKSGNTATVTITDRQGTEKSVEIFDGDDYVLTEEDKQEIINTVEAEVSLDIPTKLSQLENDSAYINKEVNNLTNYTLKTNTGSSIELSINNSTYVMTLNLKNSAGTTISTGTIDLPLETMVVGAIYDNTNKKIVLTLKNGSTIDVPVADLVSGLQAEITNANKLSADLVDDTSTTHKFTSTSEKNSWNAKYNKPSGGIPSTDLASDVQTSLGKAETAVQDVSEKEDKTNKTSTIDENSTNTQYPNAKAVYDALVLRDEEISDLKTKNELLVKDHVPIENTGTELQLTGTGDLPMELVPYGNISQETREGYNVLNVSAMNAGSNTKTFSNDVLTLTTDTAITYSSSYINISNLWKANAGKTLRFQYESFTSSSNLTGRLVQITVSYTDGTANSYYELMARDGSRTNAVIPADTSNVNSVFLNIYVNNSSSAQAGTVTITKPMLFFGTTDKEYEAYGAAPSTEFESPVKVVDGSYIDKVENKNLCGEVELGGYNDTTGLKEVNSNLYCNKNPISVEPETNYVFSINGVASNVNVLFYDKNNNYIRKNLETYPNFTTPANAKYVCLYRGTSAGNEKWQLEQGSTATSYVPHAEQTVSIDTSPNPLYSENDCYKYLTSEQTTALELNTGAGWYCYNEYYNQNFTSGVSSVTINDMKSNGQFYSSVGGTVSGTTITFDGTTTGEGNIIYELATPTYTKITNANLIASLEALKNMQSYYDVTNISQTHGDNQADMRINANALKSLKAMQSETDTLLNAKVDKSSFVYDSNTETLSITIS